MTTRAITRIRTRLNLRYGWEDRARGEAGGVELGIDTLVVGRIAAIIFIVCGLLGLVGLLLPTGEGADSLGVIIASTAAIVAGIVTTFLPWHRWPRWHTHWLILVGFGLIGLGISFYGEFAYAFGAMFCICFTAVGLAHRAGTSLLMLPLFMAAYAAPIAVRTGDVVLAVSFAVFIGALCVMVAEIVSWVTSRLHRSQAALLSAHAAVNDISADLTSMDAVGLAQKATVRLSKLLDSSDVSVYTLAGDGRVDLPRRHHRRPAASRSHGCERESVVVAPRVGRCCNQGPGAAARRLPDARHPSCRARESGRPRRGHREAPRPLDSLREGRRRTLGVPPHRSLNSRRRSSGRPRGADRQAGVDARIEPRRHERRRTRGRARHRRPPRRRGARCE